MHTPKLTAITVQNLLGTQFVRSLIEAIMKALNNLFKQEEEIPECTHSWVLFAKNYAPPRKEIPEGIGDTLIEKALLGVTTYLWQCVLCSSVRRQESLGSDGNHLNELLEKADKIGIQYVEQDNKTFAIARVPDDDPRLPLK